MPPCAASKQSLAVLVRAGEGALDVAEQFGFQKRFRKGAAIDGDEGLLAAGAVFVNRARDQFLAGAGFAGDQDAAGLRRDGHDHVEDGAHLRAVADDVVLAGEAAQFAPQVAGFVLEAQGFVHLAHGAAQLIDQVVVLDHVAVRAGIDRGDGGLHRGHAGNQQKIARGRNFLAELQQFDAGRVRHANIGNHDVENLGFQFAARGFAVQGHFDAMAFLAKGNLQQFANGALVVDDQNVSHIDLLPSRCRARQATRGRSTVNSAPLSFSENTLMRPLCACTI